MLKRVDWHHQESYTSECGMVYRDTVGDWIGKVTIEGKYARLSETFVSAEVAKGAVERTFEREKKR